MTITIIEANDGTRVSDITWTVTGGCYYCSPCSVCPFGALINITQSELNCLYHREQFIVTTFNQPLPYTFDTDDYPELLI